MGRALLLSEEKVTTLRTALEAIADLKSAHERLLAAITATEASRKLLHEAGEECWIDKLDHEPNGNGGA
jgi:hypothetical protein